MIKKIILILAALVAASCQNDDIQKQTYSHPNWSKNQKQEFTHRRIVVASTNSFKGHLEGVSEEIAPTLITRNGGAKALNFYIETLKKRYNDQLVLLDGGFIYNHDDNSLKKSRVLDLYRYLDFDAVLFTENEMSEQSTLEYYDIPFVSSNIIDLQTAKPIEKDFLLPHRIISKNGLKIGILGTTSFKKNERQKKIGIYFEDPVLSILKTKEFFDKNKVDITILLAHFETDCKSKESYENNKSDRLLECPESRDELKKLIKRLPPNTVDLIVGTDATDSIGFYKDIPVIQNNGHGLYINRIELFYDTVSKKIISEKTKIHTPTKLCRRFFKASEDCHIANNNESQKKIKAIQDDQFKMTDAVFLGRKYKEDSLPFMP